MTELARTPPSLQRLFQAIDLAPLAQDQVIAESLGMWRERRGHDLAPQAADILHGQAPCVHDHSFLAEPLPGTRDYAVSEAGEGARAALDLKDSAERVSQSGARRIAVRLRQLFRLVLDYGEPIIVKFVEGQRSYELLAAPVATPGGGTVLFCTLTFDELTAGPG